MADRPTARDHGAAARSRSAAARGTASRPGPSIAPHTIEEAYELADAIERGDPMHVRDELGDLLFQVVFQSRIAEEQGLFDFDDVADAISDKLERRHPHVFGDATIADAAEQTARLGSSTRRRSARRRAGRRRARRRDARPAGADARGEARPARGAGRLRLADAAGRARQGARGDRRAAAGASAAGDVRARQRGTRRPAVQRRAAGAAPRRRSRGRAARRERASSSDASASIEARARGGGPHAGGRRRLAELEALWARAKRELG